eukprot:TRINITY_DN12413_c0_g1_i4.p2 TRINITY_DN12413_c0_g1~~TRINITY_DN12413_c0_g1_i4.p2  ORF type:complete len:182 (+),score=28.57 TRINITY_DN12413_c0_g1_i4:64-609(+)
MCIRDRCDTRWVNEISVQPGLCGRSIGDAREYRVEASITQHANIATRAGASCNGIRPCTPLALYNVKDSMDEKVFAKITGVKSMGLSSDVPQIKKAIQNGEVALVVVVGDPEVYLGLDVTKVGIRAFNSRGAERIIPDRTIQFATIYRVPTPRGLQPNLFEAISCLQLSCIFRVSESICID